MCLQNCSCSLYSRPCSGASDAPSQLQHQPRLHRLSWAESALESAGCTQVSPPHAAVSHLVGAPGSLYQSHTPRGSSFQKICLVWGNPQASCPDCCSFCVLRAA